MNFYIPDTDQFVRISASGWNEGDEYGRTINCSGAEKWVGNGPELMTMRLAVTDWINGTKHDSPIRGLTSQ